MANSLTSRWLHVQLTVRRKTGNVRWSRPMFYQLYCITKIIKIGQRLTKLLLAKEELSWTTGQYHCQ